MKSKKSKSQFWVSPLALVLAAACGGGGGAGVGPGQTGDDNTTTTGGDLGNGVFESANPSGTLDTSGNVVANGVGSTPTAGGGDLVASPGMAGTSTGSGTGSVASDGSVLTGSAESAPTIDPNGAPPPSDDVARSIEEADVVKVSGDRLYALSSFGGLSVVDISNPDALKLLGRHRTTATPFEMYVRDETVFVLYNGYGEYVVDDATDTWTFYQTSYVIALDTADPRAIVERQKFEIPGYIADSRLIGDVMYVAAFDDSYCYRCSDSMKTNVMSLNVSDPSAIVQVDELTFAEQESSYSWRRSLTATDERLYIAGPRYGAVDPDGSIVQVVDITDGNGDMIEGDRLEVAGQINSRWQMDEYEGVLRVISQPLWWTTNGSGVPRVETFEIVSSSDLQPLGSTDITLPTPETLQTVRFDGTRGYAITFQQTDPLFTIDLSDPANPAQVGQLVMPGWVYYMEPRGERVIGLGYDEGNPEGALTVSIFDVSDLATPTMLSRVNFGGDYAQLAEDQDRIHKSFQVLDDRELVLVPYSGWSYGEYDELTCYQPSTYESGVQLIDWVDDVVTLRGVAESQGSARRAFFVGERLLTMSDERVEAFDVTDRGAPTSTSFVDLAQVVNQLAASGDTIARLGNGWWDQGELEVTVSSLDQLLAYEPGVTVSLPDLNRQECNSYTYFDQMMSAEDRVYFFYRSYDYSSVDGKEQTHVRTLDVSDPTAPSVAGDATLDLTPNYNRAYIPGMVDNGLPSVTSGSTLVFAQHDTQYNDAGFIIKSGYTLEVVDLADADAPVRTSVALPNSIGSTGLLTSGNVVASSHFEISPTNSNNVRFFLDRVDVSDARAPELSPSLNIPGSLLAYDADTERALTVDYQFVTINDVSPKQCLEVEFGQFVTPDVSLVDYEAGRGPCNALRFKLYLLDASGATARVLGSYAVDKGVQITSAAIGEDRVFLGTGQNAGVYYATNEGGVVGGVGVAGPAVDVAVPGGYYYTYYQFQSGEAKLLVASGLGTGELQVSNATLETGNNFYGFGQILAKGQKAVVATGWEGRLSVVDATDAANPVVARSAELGAAYVNDLDLAGNVAVAALGQSGVQTLSLGE